MFFFLINGTILIFCTHIDLILGPGTILIGVFLYLLNLTYYL